jgi:hypothetical protein
LLREMVLLQLLLRMALLVFWLLVGVDAITEHSTPPSVSMILSFLV